MRLSSCGRRWSHDIRPGVWQYVRLETYYCWKTFVNWIFLQMTVRECRRSAGKPHYWGYKLHATTSSGSLSCRMFSLRSDRKWPALVFGDWVSEDLLAPTPAVCVFLWAIAGLISTGREKCIKPHLNVNEVLYLWQRAYITNVYFNKPISLCSEL